MKILNSAIVVVLFGLASSLHAASPSSVAAQSETKPSTVNTNGGFDFKARDSGNHSGWCQGQGHLVSPGDESSGHRNHWDCDSGGGSDDPAVCAPDEILINGVCLPWV
ncbi:MAG: hypothetical protein D4R84_04155 [Rhodocyclaceae bacterium]|nr:MAG: hypothetical protein D4R84_04155 [Rhodocyclaceae bacterium]